MFLGVQINRFALTDFMEGEGLRLTDLAEKSGVSISFLSELRSGTKTEVSPATVKKLADALGVRVRSIATSSDSEAVA
jgi:transcriptional regulator with XRE-family HTH domain